MRHIVVLVPLLALGAAVHAQPADPAPALIKQLQSKKTETRTDAMLNLAELGPKAAPAVDALARFLPRVNEEERILATLALGKIGKASLPAVEKLLTHEDETTRYYAVWAIGLVGTDAHALMPRLLKMFATEEDEDVRIKLLYVLARVAPGSKEALAVLANRAHSQDRPAERMVAIEELRNFGAGALKPLLKVHVDETKTDLDKLLSAKLPIDFNPFAPTPLTKARESLLHLLDANRNDAFAKEARPHVPELLCFAPVLPGAPILVDEGITFLLSKHASSLFADMDAVLKGNNRKACPAAVTTIAKLAAYMHPRGENPELVKKMVNVLLKCAKDPDDLVRSEFVLHAPVNEVTLAALEELLFDRNSTIRQVAFSRFQMSGFDGTTKLYEKLREAKGEERLHLAISMFTMGERSAEVRDILRPNLMHRDAGVRHRIAVALSSQWAFPVEDDSQDLAPMRAIMRVLIESLKTGDASRRIDAMFAIATCKHAREFVPELLVQIDDPVLEVRLNLLPSIGAHGYGADARATMKKLLPNLDDKNETIRYHAVFLLAPLHDLGSSHLIRLAEKDPSQRIWEQACAQLARVRPITEDTIPALMRMAQDKRRAPAALAALAEIDHEGTFAAALKSLMTGDERLRKALGVHPNSTWEKSGTLIDALLKDARQADLSRCRDAVHALNVILPMLPVKVRAPTALRLFKEFPAQLTMIGKDRKAKDARVRLESAHALLELRQLELAATRLAPLPFDMDEKNVKQGEERMKLEERFEKLIIGARGDPELAIRRLARKADGSRPQTPPALFPFGPGGFEPRPVWMPLLPASIGPGSFGPGLPDIGAILNLPA